MQLVNLDRIYSSIAEKEHTNVHSAVSRYGENLEVQPLYAQTPFKYVTGDKPQKNCSR
jgi:hypothetical protein